jgi:16S rRNA processing protein RimM
MNEAEKLRNWEVIIKREDASPLGENEFYVADMIGADIIDENGNKLGEFKDILDTAGGRIMVFESALLTTKKGNPKEMLVPYIPQYILNKDIENRKIMIKVIPGLLD